MEQVIKQAIEGGWKKGFIVAETARNDVAFIGPKGYTRFEYTYAEIVLDPLFWQALGKAEGWGETQIYDRITGKPTLIMFWRLKQYEFIDHLAEGKEVEEFFTDLIKKDK